MTFFNSCQSLVARNVLSSEQKILELREMLINCGLLTSRVLWELKGWVNSKSRIKTYNMQTSRRKRENKGNSINLIEDKKG